MVVYEATETLSLTPAKRAIFSSQRLNNWLLRTCYTEQQSGPLFRFYDDDLTAEQLVNVSQTLRDAYVATRSKAQRYPAIGISNGRTGIVTDLPGSVDEVIALVEKYK